MGIVREKDHLDPSNPLYYAPRRMREEANADLPASTDTMRGVPPLSSADALVRRAISKSFHSLDPVAMHEPPASGPLQWRDLIPAAGRLAAAIGIAALAALFFVLMIPASKNQAQDGNGSRAVEAHSAASDPQASSGKQASRDDGATPALAQFGTILAASQTAPPAGPAITREESDALLQQFLRWQQKLDSTDTPSQ